MSGLRAFESLPGDIPAALCCQWVRSEIIKAIATTILVIVANGTASANEVRSALSRAVTRNTVNVVIHERSTDALRARLGPEPPAHRFHGAVR